jgi:hypothetical protein
LGRTVSAGRAVAAPMNGAAPDEPPNKYRGEQEESEIEPRGIIPSHRSFDNFLTAGWKLQKN